MGIQVRENNSLNYEHSRDSPKMAPLIVRCEILYSCIKPKSSRMGESGSCCQPDNGSVYLKYLHK